MDAVKARILKGEEAKDGPLMPWFRGFEGNVKRSSRGVFRFEGNVSHNRLKVNIKELPPRVWTQQYKETLSSMVQDGSINSFTEDHSEAKVSFTLSVSRAQLKSLQAKKDGLLGSLRLKSNMLTSNMHCVNAETRAVQSYDSTVSLMDEFMPLRSELYVKRRNYEIENLEIRVHDLEERANFVDSVTSGKVVLSNRPRDSIVSELRERGFSEYPRGRKDDDEKKRPYDHLLSMSLSELSRERIDRLRSQSDRASLDLSTLQATSPNDLWISDLDKLRNWFSEEGGYEKRKSRPKY